MITKKVIYGCKSRGDGDSAYLTHWTLLTTRWGELKLHIFHRSDADDLHDHPWNFWSVILWPGYLEVTPGEDPKRPNRLRRWPLVPAYRPAEWQHRVQLLTRGCPECTRFQQRGGTILHCPRCQGLRLVMRPCWTLIWTGPRVREWSFFTKAGAVNWRQYFQDRGC